MPGLRIQVKLEGIPQLQNRLARLATRAGDPEALTAALAALMETQVKRRISDEKTAPDGSTWQAWDPAYARTRKANHSLLVNDQNLMDSIAGSSNDHEAVVGSEMIYARVHQEGWPERGIPARPFLGLSQENVNEIDQTVNDWMEGLFQ